MKLTGIIEDVFRGVTIFRGYATLKTLAKFSVSTSYQRDKEPDRIDAITDYISNSSYVFYPELILGWQLDNPDAIRIIKEEENTSKVSLGNDIKIKKAKFKFKILPTGEEPKTKVNKETTQETKKEEKKVEEPKNEEKPKNEKKKETIDYSEKTLTELKNIAKEQGLKGYSSMKKDELIDALTK